MSHVSQEQPKTAGRVIHWARLYDLGTRLCGFGTGRHKLLLDLAAVAPGERVLDVGCGPGSLALIAKERVGASGDIHGIDAGAEMIELARAKAAKAHLDVKFQIALIEELPFPDGHFDVVLSSLMLHHLPDDLKRRGFAEIARVLKPAGRLLAVDLSPTGAFKVINLFLWGHHRLPPTYVDDLVAMLRDAGFSAEVLDTSRRAYAFIRAQPHAPVEAAP